MVSHRWNRWWSGGVQSNEMITKFILGFTPEQISVLDKIQDSLSASSRGDVIKKALSLIALYVDVKEKRQRFCVADENGNVIEFLRFQ